MPNIFEVMFVIVRIPNPMFQVPPFPDFHAESKFLLGSKRESALDELHGTGKVF